MLVELTRRAATTTRTTLPCWPLAVSVGREGGNLSVQLDAAAPPNPVNSTPEGLRHDDAMIMFTGGTTGLPKMVPWTHGQHRRLGAGDHRRVRARPAGRDGRGDAALPRSRADRRVAVDPGIRGHRVAARARAVLGAHVLGRHRRRSAPPGTPRCRRFTRSCWSATRPSGRAATEPRCASSAAAARRSPPRRRRRCRTCSPRRYCAPSA